MRKFRVFLWFICAVISLAVLSGIAFWMRPVECFRELLYVRLALNGVESRSVTVAGHRMHYDAAGPADGPPVVLVHGLGGRAEDWANLAPLLVRAGFRVYLPDLPGFGRSEQPVDFSYSIADQAGAVVGFMDAMGLKQVDLGGWSMGGWIVQWIASQHPDRVKRLILFDSAGLYVKPEWSTALFTPANAAELDQLDALLMPHPPVFPAFVAADLLRVSHRNAWVTRRALDSMLTGRDSTDKLLPGLKMPVLIVWGDEDRITPPSEGQTIHTLIPQSQLEVAAGCGHLAPGQCADKIAPGLVEFLRH
jgi:pimeloyl-ACP methyl ester carboxylesterase